MKLFNNTSITGTVLATLACASFMSCTRNADSSAGTNSAISETQSTASNTTLAADDTPKTLDTTGSIPPGAADENTSATAKDATTTKTATKTTTKTKHWKKHAKKAHTDTSSRAWAPAAPVVSNDDDYFYDNDVAADSTNTAVDSTQDFTETVSGTTMAPQIYRETGLSPFAQEPNSRLPLQIGSGQLTGEDKSTTILEGPSLFQDPAALGRDLIQ